MSTLNDYREVAPRGAVDFISRMAERVKGRRFLHVSATRYGGGVAEILHRLVPMLAELGIEASWEVITGNPLFYTTTRALHRALQGTEQVVTEEMLEAYRTVNRDNARRLPLDADLVLVHDPQPAGLVEHRPATGRWVWRCHLDVSAPQRRIWSFLRRLVVRYDAAVFSLPRFAPSLPIPQYLVYPSIDPLADKNRRLTRQEVDATLDRLGVPRDKPILLQVSRWDRFTDPLGVVNAFRMVRRHNDCRLVLAGGGAADDPEGAGVLAEVRQATGSDPDMQVLELPPDAHLEINALQRAATVVLQKSLREGFGLTVAEAMWKGKPVIGGAAGGISAQILHDVTGYLVHSSEGAAFWLRYLLNNPETISRLGGAGREHVRRNFLVTRHLADYLSLLVRVVG
ncbi:MAG: glycosyltransferase [Candidatus Rokuibacteriota bacterium]